MGQLTDSQRRILGILVVEHGWWAKATSLASMLGINPQGCGMALKGLYKRGLVDRRPPAPKDSAEYRINAEGIKEAQRHGE